jgi:outer membrane lipoprotein SlyB
MEAPAIRQTHPFVIIAAVALTVFSLVGIGAILGWIPTSMGGGGVKPAATEPAQPAADAAGPLAQSPAAPAVAQEPVAPKQAVKQPKPRRKAVARSEPPLQVAQAEPAPAVVPSPPVAAAACRECAVIEEIREIEKDGEGSGGGAVAGGVVGGVLGHRIGSGRGNDIATVLGAVGGAVAGHHIEKNVTKTKEYQIFVRYEDGSRGLFTQGTPPSWRPGDKVKIVDGVIRDRG